jgi:hypothetical protein
VTYVAAGNDRTRFDAFSPVRIQERKPQ